MKTKLWIINQYAGSPYHGNGYRHYFIAKKLREKNIEATIFAGSYSHLMYELPKVNSTFTNQKIDEIDFVWVKLLKYTSARSFKRIISMFQFTLKLMFLLFKKNEKPDYILVSSLSIYPVLSCYLLSKKYKVPLILEIRDIWPLTLTQVGGYSINHPFVRITGWFEKFGYKNADYLISVLSNFDVHAKHILKDKVFKFKYIPNGVELPKNNITINFDMSLFLHSNGVPKDKFYVCYAGSIGIANSLDSFIDSAINFHKLSQSTNVHFVVIGEGYEKERLMQKSASISNISFLPKIKKEEIPIFLKKMDILYLSWQNKPEIYQFGISANKMYEYMLAAKPIIMSAPLIPYNIIDISGCGKTIEPDSYLKIIETIDYYNKLSVEQRNNIGDKGYKFVTENNTFEVLSQQYVDVLDELKKK